MTRRIGAVTIESAVREPERDADKKLAYAVKGSCAGVEHSVVVLVERQHIDHCVKYLHQRKEPSDAAALSGIALAEVLAADLILSRTPKTLRGPLR